MEGGNELKKKQSFTLQESKRLIELVLENMEILRGTDKKGCSGARREAKGIEITKVNSDGGCGAIKRTVDECKKLDCLSISKINRNDDF